MGYGFESDKRVSAGNIGVLARDIAVLELHRARLLARLLPETARFEDHFELALAIGAAGRRIETLIPAFLEQARFPYEIAPITEWSVERDRQTLPTPTYRVFYQDVKELLSSFGYRTYDLRVRLDICLAFDTAADQMISVPSFVGVGSPLDRFINTAHTERKLVSTKLRRARRGPSRHASDPRWMVRSADEYLPRMPRVEERDGLLQKLHHTALRETVASEVAALNLLEYDGLPWSFYLDMARQCEDEARHAMLTANALRDRGGEIGDYPVPYLGNYYEMFWEMTLAERLVAMNLDIEAVGQGYLASIPRRLEVLDKDASELYDFICVDENRHARIGVRWLEYLYPQAACRREAIEACRGLLLVNLASAHAAAMGGTVVDTLDRWAESGGPFRFDVPRGIEHEPEITHLFSRRTRHRVAH